MRSSIEWHCQDEERNPFKRWNPMRPLLEWHNGRTMNRYIGAELDKRFEDWKHSTDDVEVESTDEEESLVGAPVEKVLLALQ